LLDNCSCIVVVKIVTISGKIGLIAHLEIPVLNNYFYSLQMVVAMYVYQMVVAMYVYQMVVAMYVYPLILQQFITNRATILVILEDSFKTEVDSIMQALKWVG